MTTLHEITDRLEPFVHGLGKAVLRELREALAQQGEQQPVIGTKTWMEDGKLITQHLYASDIYKDAAPAAQPLTDEQIKHIYLCVTGWSISDGDPLLVDFARAIEAAHGIGADK